MAHAAGSPLGRRQFLGLALFAASGGMVACSSGHPGGVHPLPTTTSTTEPPSPDTVPLRLASSLEHYLVGLYQTVAGTGLLTTPALVEATNHFASQHSDHANAFEQLTIAAKGQPFTTANLVVADSLSARLQTARDEAGILKLLYDVEAMVLATYYSGAGAYVDPTLNASVASVAAVEARHVAVLGMALSGVPAALAGVSPRTDSSPFAPSGFVTSEGAVAPGTGV